MTQFSEVNTTDNENNEGSSDIENSNRISKQSSDSNNETCLSSDSEDVETKNIVNHSPNDQSKDSEYIDDEKTKEIIKEIDSDDTKCGIGFCKPKWAQVSKTRKKIIIYHFLNIVKPRERIYYRYFNHNVLE